MQSGREMTLLVTNMLLIIPLLLPNGGVANGFQEGASGNGRSAKVRQKEGVNFQHNHPWPWPKFTRQQPLTAAQAKHLRPFNVNFEDGGQRQLATRNGFVKRLRWHNHFALRRVAAGLLRQRGGATSHPVAVERDATRPVADGPGDKLDVGEFVEGDIFLQRDSGFGVWLKGDEMTMRQLGGGGDGVEANAGSDVKNNIIGLDLRQKGLQCLPLIAILRHAIPLDGAVGEEVEGNGR